MIVWLVSFQGHNDGLHPTAIFSDEEAAREYMKTDRGVIWELTAFDLDGEQRDI